MMIPRMETISPSLDRSFWHPLGMESSGSFQIDLTHSRIDTDDLIGNPGDFYRDPHVLWRHHPLCLRAGRRRPAP